MSRRETIEHWVGDFVSSTAFRDTHASIREFAPEVLVRFVEAACSARDVNPDDLEPQDMKPGMLDGVAKLALPASIRSHAPALCASFLATMQDHGRLAGGHDLARVTRALRPAYLEAASGTTKPIVNPGSRIGRNHPCPCGSGKKYKKCCQR